MTDRKIKQILKNILNGYTSLPYIRGGAGGGVNRGVAFTLITPTSVLPLMKGEEETVKVL